MTDDDDDDDDDVDDEDDDDNDDNLRHVRSITNEKCGIHGASISSGSASARSAALA